MFYSQTSLCLITRQSYQQKSSPSQTFSRLIQGNQQWFTVFCMNQKSFHSLSRPVYELVTIMIGIKPKQTDPQKTVHKMPDWKSEYQRNFYKLCIYCMLLYSLLVAQHYLYVSIQIMTRTSNTNQATIYLSFLPTRKHWYSHYWIVCVKLLILISQS